ncbi:MAG: hypothetical protein HYZ92_03505 [Candidatus Omnitrophica bacterium]|nr:hypothetical protein [Candidatus Omnitrophota bacterium]
MDPGHRFQQTLLRMLQEGRLQEILGCQDGRSATVEFHLERIYHLHVARRHITLAARDVELIRRRINGRWKRVGKAASDEGRIILDRLTTKVLTAPGLGRIRNTRIRQDHRTRATPIDFN